MHTPDITQSDLSAVVKMDRINAGYFERRETIQAFIDIGVAPLLPSLGESLFLASFGGGEGGLPQAVVEYLRASGRRVSCLLVDANPAYLRKATERGLATLCGDLSEIALGGIDLITMRSVNHYNAIPIQRRILQRAYAALKPGGVLISQNLSGPSDAYCRMASQLSKYPSLGRIAEDHDAPHITSESEFAELMADAGFTDIKVAGHAPVIEVGPSYYWNRFNAHRRAKALETGNDTELVAIDKRHEIYSHDAEAGVASFLAQATAEEAEPIRVSDGKHALDLSFPVFVGRRGEDAARSASHDST